jgi:hypothetical protein
MNGVGGLEVSCKGGHVTAWVPALYYSMGAGPLLQGGCLPHATAWVPGLCYGVSVRSDAE